MSGRKASVPSTIGVIISAIPSPSKYCMVVFFSMGYNGYDFGESGGFLALKFIKVQNI
jgi:hypothetical protein